ncbi:zinc finger protein 62 homolog [Neocloeon triangulifer]|uniref:zinc finger protein 62 homolog n=1 Tax=Neocloeon triangulifer TaxID=2078957 RepID=UPI00286F0912|nr:zinc finger protein 62 homolog [Neocloeon triangulifer]
MMKEPLKMDLEEKICANAGSRESKFHIKTGKNAEVNAGPEINTSIKRERTKLFKLRQIKVESDDVADSNAQSLPVISQNIKSEPIEDEDDSKPNQTNIQHFGKWKPEKSAILKKIKKDLDNVKPLAAPLKRLTIRMAQLEHGKKFTCDICKKGVGTKGGLKYHIQAHLFGRPFKCKICMRSYATKNDFDTHNKRHSGKNVICNFCQKQFPVKSYLGDHIFMKHLPREFVCHICSKPRYYFRKAELEKHLAVAHFPKIKLSCKLCNRNYKSKDTYDRHCEERKLMKHKCAKCEAKFPCRYLLFAHRKEEAKKPARRVECPLCDENVFDLDYHHRKVHRKESCDICPFRGNVMSLLAHKKDCGSQKQIRALGFGCERCDLFFRTDFYLQEHIRKTHGHIKCHRCPKTFMTSSSLNNHTRDTHNKRPYGCVLCPAYKHFKTRDSFDVHFRARHEFPKKIRNAYGAEHKNRFGCDKCKQANKFGSKLEFIKHINSCYNALKKISIAK